MSSQMQKLIVKILEQKGHQRGLDRRFKLDSQNFVDVQLGLQFQNFRYPVNLLFLDDEPVDWSKFGVEDGERHGERIARKLLDKLKELEKWAPYIP